jgi:hypothetical protein
MLKLQRTMGRNVVFVLSGRLEADSLGDLSALIAAEQAGLALVLDLKDLVVVDRDVRFLSDHIPQTLLKVSRLRTSERTLAILGVTKDAVTRAPCRASSLSTTSSTGFPLSLQF